MGQQGVNCICTKHCDGLRGDTHFASKTAWRARAATLSLVTRPAVRARHSVKLKYFQLDAALLCLEKCVRRTV